MKQLTCEMCGGTDLMKQDGAFVCQNCGMKYSVEEAQKMMIEGTVDVQGTVKIDNSDFVQKYLANAKRAYSNNDWEEVEKYYGMVEQNDPNNMEAVFFTAFGRAMLSLTNTDYYNRKQKFTVLNSVVVDCFGVATEDREAILRSICDAIAKMFSADFVYNKKSNIDVGGKTWQKNIFDGIKKTFIKNLKKLSKKHSEPYIKELITRAQKIRMTGCYVATAVYGSYDCPQVWTLRRYRDYTLAETWYGRAFIHTYYAISPTLVKWFGHTEWFKKMWQGKLDRMVAKLQADGVEDTPYEDKAW